MRKIALFVLAIAGMGARGSFVAQAQAVLTQHVRDAVASGQATPVGRLPQDEILQLDLVLPLRDQAGLDAFVRELYDPSSASYRKFLTVAEFTDKFGPTEADYNAVVSFAKTNGLTVVGGSRDGMDVEVRGPVSAVESAFHVTMRTYRHPSENRIFYGPDSEPVTNLPFALWHVSGLDNYSIPTPRLEKKSDAASANGADAGSDAATGSGPGASFLGSDMRAAYYGGTALTGAGQNLGLLEFYGTDIADLNTYFANTGQTRTVPITLLSVDGTSTSCVDNSAGGRCDDTEQTLDMTQALGMAPGLASLTMYVGSSDTALLSAMTSNSPLPTTIGCSWGWTPVDPTTLDPYFKRMAAQGQTFFAASGDSSTWSSHNAAWPSDDANVVSVGGTDLVTASAGGAWGSETAWGASGGGISPDGIPIPSWQLASGVINSSNNGSTALRNGPDVSANANYSYYVCADQTACTANYWGGTSFAAPAWAGYLALANQQLASQGDAPIGFINPIIYAQNLTSEYSTDFHDITSGTSGSYSAVAGYDLVTGWGSPNGQGLINALVASAGSPSATFNLSASPSAVSVAQGAGGTSAISTSVLNGFSSAVVLSASGQPSGVTVSFSPASIASPGAGSSTMTMAVASTVATGTYTITVTASGGGVTKTATVLLTVTPAPTFSLSASLSTVSVTQGSSGTSTISTGALNGFNSAIALSASGQPAGVTVSFSPASIASPGSGSSTVTMAVASTVAAGTYRITVTATGGGVTQTATVSLTVAASSASFALSVSPTSGSLVQGHSGSVTVSTSITGGFNSAVALSASGQPAGVTVSFSPSTITSPASGRSTMTMAVASTVAAGIYPITVTATGGGVTQTATMSLTVTAAPGFTLTASPTALTVFPGQSVTATISTTATAGFNYPIALSVADQPPGVTVTLSQSTITTPASGQVTMTVTMTSATAPSGYNITIAGTADYMTKEAKVLLTTN